MFCQMLGCSSEQKDIFLLSTSNLACFFFIIIIVLDIRTIKKSNIWSPPLRYSQKYGNNKYGSWKG